jgi:hypothetical protein
MNFNPQQTLRNNHLFFGFGRSSRMLRHSFGSLISGRLRRCCSFLTLALYKCKNPRSADKNLPSPAKLNWNAITLQTKQCLLRNRLCCRDRAPVCVHKTGADFDDNRISVGTPPSFCRSRASVIIAWPRFKISKPLIAKRRSDSIQRHAAALRAPIILTSKWGIRF